MDTEAVLYAPEWYFQTSLRKQSKPEHKMNASCDHKMIRSKYLRNKSRRERMLLSTHYIKNLVSHDMQHAGSPLKPKNYTVVLIKNNTNFTGRNPTFHRNKTKATPESCSTLGDSVTGRRDVADRRY